MVPVYALTSWLSMLLPYLRIYFDTINEVFESFAIYSFAMMLFSYMGGERKLSLSLEF